MVNERAANVENKEETKDSCCKALTVLKNSRQKVKEFNTDWENTFGITFPQLTGLLAAGFSTFSAFMILINKYGMETVPVFTTEDIIKRGLLGFTFVMGYTTKMFFDAQKKKNEEILINMVTSKIYYKKLQNSNL